MHSIVATPSMLGGIGPVRTHIAANRLHEAMVLQCCGHMHQSKPHDLRAKNPSTLMEWVGRVGWHGAGWGEWGKVGGVDGLGGMDGAGNDAGIDGSGCGWWNKVLGDDINSGTIFPRLQLKAKQRPRRALSRTHATSTTSLCKCGNG